MSKKLSKSRKSLQLIGAYDCEVREWTARSVPPHDYS